MKWGCPKNPEHKQFVTVAHISQDWLVDEYGSFIEVVQDCEVVADPCPGNIWTCNACGADAILLEE